MTQRDDASREPREDYLFDGSGTPDADVRRLEGLLRPLAAKEVGAGSAITPPRAHPVGLRRLVAQHWARLAAGGIAAVLLVGFVVGIGFSGSVDVCVPPGPADGNVYTFEDIPVRDAGSIDSAHAAGAWIETADDERELLVGDVGRVRLAARSRLQVRHAKESETLLYLARGSLEATVSADARPRFFQVDTDAARCVDLGCKYTLDVDAEGVATVRVTTGQVAFETRDKEVFVPAGATCVARPGTGPGTPRFDDCGSAVAEAFDALDAAANAPAEERIALAKTALAAVSAPRDTLPVWHLLQDADAEIVREARTKLERLAGTCDVPSDGTAADDLRAWKAYLYGSCW